MTQPGQPAAPRAVPIPDNQPGAEPGGTRTAAGSSYGDFAPDPDAAPGLRDPSRGAEMERDSLPPDADFSLPPFQPRPFDPQQVKPQPDPLPDATRDPTPDATPDPTPDVPT